MSRKRITITAGNCVDIIEYTAPDRHDTPRQRAAKSRASSEARKLKNAAMSRRNLKMRLAANFTPGRDYFCTLTFAPASEPQSRAACEAAASRFVRRLRDVRRRRGQPLRWVYVVEHRHGEGRWHIHFVINAAAGWRHDLEEVESLWELGAVQLSQLFTGKYREKRWADIAKYLSKERTEDDPKRAKVGTHTYHCCRGLILPSSKTVTIQSTERAEAPKHAHITDYFDKSDMYAGVRLLNYELPYLIE